MAEQTREASIAEPFQNIELNVKATGCDLRLWLISVALQQVQFLVGMTGFRHLCASRLLNMSCSCRNIFSPSFTTESLMNHFVRLMLCGMLLQLVGELHATAADVRNVLFIISDDLKASVLGCYGDTYCRTPNIDRLAKKGMVFERAYCQGVWCAPSRASLMRGRYEGKQELTWGEHVQKHGYYSGRVGKIFHMRVPGDIIDGTNGPDVEECWSERFNSPGKEAHTPGDYACLNLNIFTDALENRQSTRMPHRMFVTVQYDGDGSDQPDHKSATKAIELLQKNRETPFFLAVGLVRPHYPMVAPRQYFQPYPWQTLPLPASLPNETDDIPKLGIAGTNNLKNPIGKYPDNQKRMWQGYYASVEFMDAQVGRIVNELERLKLADSTAIIFTSDHGYHLGEHGFWQKSNLHEEVTRIPLVISSPGMQPGRTKSLVELVDLFPTACDLTGLPIPDSVQGISLKPVLVNPSEAVKSSALSFHKGTALRTPDWAYMKYQDGSEELYDMKADPKQFHNLANVESLADQKKLLRKQLKSRLTQIR